jgi:hypothetical protein
MRPGRIRTPNLFNWFAAALAAFATSSAHAGTVPLGGSAKAGHGRPPIHVNLTPATSTSYTPAQVRHAYGFDQLPATGASQRIGIVVAYGNPNIQASLNAFCSRFGLSSTRVEVIGRNTGGNSAWALETALDVEWAHAIASGAEIILSVAASSSNSDLLNAVDAAANAGAAVVSMSWGGLESPGMSTYDGHFNRPGVTFVASSGDNGAGVEWPAVSPFVIGVGGTTLILDSNGNRKTETAWSGSGGGISRFSSEPTFQSGWQSSGHRSVPDVSYLADPASGVYVYDSVNGGWFVVGGTSAGAPQWAALIALANDARASAGIAQFSSANSLIFALAKGSTTVPYSVNPSYFFDVTSGNNGGYNAAPHYDFVTGLGSPKADSLVAALALPPRLPDLAVAAMDVPAQVVQFQPIPLTIVVTNQGTAEAVGPMHIGVGLSTDCVPANGNDISLGTFPVVLNPPLQPGEARAFSFVTGPIGNAVPGAQHVIAGLDVGSATPESNKNNNLACSPIEVEGAWWDLRFEIVNAPVSANHCGSTGWVVRVTNAGNALSDNVCFISGIGLYSGAGRWGSNLGLFNGWTGQIPPGQHRDIPVTNYQVWCNALIGKQYAKVEINYSAGCNDLYTAGNYAESPVQIR